jgi:uncharacterized protein
MPESAPDYALQPRALGARLDAAASRQWMQGDVASSAVMNGFSLIFPIGEEMLMRTLAEAKGLPPLQHAPALQREVAMFLLQEGSHRLEHRRYNEALAQAGVHIGNPIAVFSALLPTASLTAPMVQRLAACAALEHFTAIFSACVQEQFGRLCSSDSDYRRFWMWHTLEELEHRHLTFDVYRAFGGGYLLRCAMLLVMTPPFWIDTLRCMRAAAKGQSLSRWQTLKAICRVLSPVNGLSRGAARRYFAWFKPGFRFDEPAFEGLMKDADEHYAFHRRGY